MESTDPSYAQRLTTLESHTWKRFVPNPYRWHIRRICRGRVLEVGCGVGRCLCYLGSRATGVDPNAAAVAIARQRGTAAFRPAELPESPPFDTLLLSHVLEHLESEEGRSLVRTWLPRVRPGGLVVLICPQRRGQASDPTHVTYLDAAALTELCRATSVTVESVRSFPFPAFAGRWWVHNETVVVGRRAG